MSKKIKTFEVEAFEGNRSIGSVNVEAFTSEEAVSLVTEYYHFFPTADRYAVEEVVVK